MPVVPTCRHESEVVASLIFEAMLLGRHVGNLRYRSVPGDQLDRSAHAILARLEVSGPLATGVLARALGVDASTMSRQSNAMIRDGLIERVADPLGGRTRVLRPTPGGISRLAAERSAIARRLDGVVSTWEADDLEVFARLLFKFNSDLERAAVGPPLGHS
jgi:DNA-binding MarR family transcriptional regulator